MKAEKRTGICPMCLHEHVVFQPFAGDLPTMGAHMSGPRGRRAPCPGMGREPQPAQIEVLAADAVRRLVPRVDYVRLHGFGNRIFAVYGIGKGVRREPGSTEVVHTEHLNVYGPLDEWGHEVRGAKNGSRQRSVDFNTVKAKVRNPPTRKGGKS